jgi:hypothetical protein
MTEQEHKDMLFEMSKEEKGTKKFWSPSEGKNTIRILPPIKTIGEKLFYFHHKTHWLAGKPFESWNQQIVDADGNVHSPKLSVIDKAAQKFWNAGEKGSDEWKIAAALSSTDRYIYRVIVRGSADEKLPEYYESGPQIFKVLKGLIMEGEYGNIVDPLTGRDFYLIKEGKGKNTSYDQSKIGPSPKQIFESKEDIKTALINASEMKYNSLISLTDEDDMQEALDAFFESKGISTKGYVSGGSAPSKKNDDEDVEIKPKTVAKPNIKPVQETSSDDVDDLLKDFL